MDTSTILVFEVRHRFASRFWQRFRRKIDRKSASNVVLHRHRLQNRSWVRFCLDFPLLALGGASGRPWVALGDAWSSLGRPWGLQETTLGPLGAPLGLRVDPLGSLWGPSWVPLALQGSIWEGFDLQNGKKKSIFINFWTIFGTEIDGGCW